MKAATDYVPAPTNGEENTRKPLVFGTLDPGLSAALASALLRPLLGSLRKEKGTAERTEERR